MNAVTLKIFQAFLTQFLKAHRPLIEEYRRTEHTKLRIQRQTEDAGSQLDGLTEKDETIRSRDDRALPLSLWLDFGILALLFSCEVLVNYLAAEGLFLGQRLTLGITVAMTVSAALLVVAIAFEERSILQKTAEGDVVHSPVKRLAYLFVGMAFLAGTLYLRVKYFQASTSLERVLLGGLSVNAWLVGLTLTVLSAIFMGIAVYLLTHANRELAACKRAISATKSALAKLGKAGLAALAHHDRVSDNLSMEVELGYNELVGQLAIAGVLPDDEPGQTALLEDLRSRIWQAVANTRAERRRLDGEDPPDSPLTTLVPPPDGGGGERSTIGAVRETPNGVVH